MKRERKKDDKYRPVVSVKKVKNGVPTIIEVSGNRYTLTHPSHIRGNQVLKRKGNQHADRKQ